MLLSRLQDFVKQLAESESHTTLEGSWILFCVHIFRYLSHALFDLSLSDASDSIRSLSLPVVLSFFKNRSVVDAPFVWRSMRWFVRS